MIKHCFITECGKLLVIGYAEINYNTNKKVKSIFDEDSKEQKNLDTYNMFKLNTDENTDKIQDRQIVVGFQKPNKNIFVIYLVKFTSTEDNKD